MQQWNTSQYQSPDKSEQGIKQLKYDGDEAKSFPFPLLRPDGINCYCCYFPMATLSQWGESPKKGNYGSTVPRGGGGSVCLYQYSNLFAWCFISKLQPDLCECINPFQGTKNHYRSAYQFLMSPIASSFLFFLEYHAKSRPSHSDKKMLMSPESWSWNTTLTLISGGTPKLSAPTLVQASAMSSATMPAGIRNPPPVGEGQRNVYMGMIFG